MTKSLATSRRSLIQALAAGSAAIAAAASPSAVFAEGAAAGPPPDFGQPSSEEHELYG